MKKLLLGLFAALVLTTAVGCGTRTTKKEESSTTQNNQTNNGGNDANSVADDKENGSVNSVTNGTDKNGTGDSGSGTAGTGSGTDSGNVVDDVINGAEDLGEDAVNGAKDIGEDAADAIDGNGNRR